MGSDWDGEEWGQDHEDYKHGRGRHFLGMQLLAELINICWLCLIFYKLLKAFVWLTEH